MNDKTSIPPKLADLLETHGHDPKVFAELLDFLNKNEKWKPILPLIEFLFSIIELIPTDILSGLLEEIDTEKQNLKEIENTISEFLQGNAFSLEKTAADALAKYFNFSGDTQLLENVSPENKSKALDAILMIQTVYTKENPSLWKRTVEIYWNAGESAKCFKSGTSIPHDSLPPDVRESSITKNETKITYANYKHI